MEKKILTLSLLILPALSHADVTTENIGHGMVRMTVSRGDGNSCQKDLAKALQLLLEREKQIIAAETECKERDTVNRDRAQKGGGYTFQIIYR